MSSERDEPLHILQHALGLDDSVATFVIVRRNGEAHTVIVDAADYDRVMAAGPWHLLVMKNNKTMYVRRTVRVDGRKSTVFLHRFLLEPGQAVADHENGCGLDNRRSNLRIATATQNRRNVGIRRSNKSGFKGVYWRADRNSWQAQITVDRKNHFLGRFVTPELAHAAYCKAAAELHGEFANEGRW